MPFFSELKWGNIFHLGVAYFIMAMLLLELVSILLPTFDAPDRLLTTVCKIKYLTFPACK